MSVTVLLFAAACSADRVSAPKASAPHFTAAQSKAWDDAKADGKTLLPGLGLARQNLLVSPLVQSAIIDNRGGTIELKSLGLKITIPSGAITGAPIAITVKALAGSMVAYEFEPHGTVFAKPLKFEQSLDNTTWEDIKFKGVLSGGYFQDAGQLNVMGGTALLNETYPVTVSSKNVSFDIWHFSGYMVATGRTAEPTSVSIDDNL
ncbi:MAG: hypothetical protein M3Y64_02690 [Gemmatimonadota bacterium]|nr:hypothetical protein [Gemmatimonadota bacterium]